MPECLTILGHTVATSLFEGLENTMEGVDCKKVLKNINGNVLANEDFFLDLMKRNEIRLSCPGLFENI